MDITEEQNFKVIKRKYQRVAIVAAVLLGVCCGVAAACLSAVIFKTAGVNFHWALYIPIGAVIAAPAGIGFYFLLRCDDETVAKRLDKQYSLNEKVQTMVEYRGTGGDMVGMQRRQADEALSSAAAKRINVNFLLKFLFIPVVAAAMLLASIFVPAKKQTSEYTEPAFNITASQLAALNSLIADADGATELDTTVRTETVSALTTLKDELPDVKLQSVMRAKVIAVVKVVDALVASTNTYLKIYSATDSDGLSRSFASAAAKGVITYKQNSTEIKSMSAVSKNAELCNSAATTNLTEWQTDFLLVYYKLADDGTTYTSKLLTTAEMAEKSVLYADAFLQTLTDAALGESEDALCVQIKSFAASLSGISSSLGEQTYNQTLTALVKEHAEKSADALYTQAYACIMDAYIRNSLSAIFDISLSSFGDNDDVAPDEIEDDDSDEDENNSGSGGKGETEYGSNDSVYDPTTDSFVAYGTLLSRYMSDHIMTEINKYDEILNSDEATAEEKAEAKYVKTELWNYIYEYWERLTSGD